MGRLSHTTQNEQLLESILLTEFEYSSGKNIQPKRCRGTSFVMSAMAPGKNVPSGQSFLVTNRHNVDYYAFGGDNPDDLRLTKIIVHLRWRNGDEPIVCRVEIEPDALIWIDPNPYNDIALIEFKYKKIDNPAGPVYMRGNFWENRVSGDTSIDRLPLGGRLFFIGFPGHMWDHRNSLPILREAVVSSDAHFDYSAKNQPNARRVLVSGMSFSGSSGSPVFYQGLEGLLIFIGVMTGHFAIQTTKGVLTWHLEAEELDSGAPNNHGSHAGLSYFIKSSVILDIRENRNTLTWGGEWDHLNNKWK
ncbi:hypothetical protein [Pseudobdellovibrio sp. HCB154]|uniref:hypothetical protein n=1 Tax=Pseudobdellovibrio sp. HCB154 TaxID=3386277 RepID=UPI003916E1EF